MSCRRAVRSCGAAGSPPPTRVLHSRSWMAQPPLWLAGAALPLAWSWLWLGAAVVLAALARALLPGCAGSSTSSSMMPAKRYGVITTPWYKTSLLFSGCQVAKDMREPRQRSVSVAFISLN